MFRKHNVIIGLLDSQAIWYTSNKLIRPSNITAFGNQAVLEWENTVSLFSW